jgi:hypothetical protein
MRGSVIAIVVVVTILIGGGAGYLVGNSTERTVTSVSMTTETLVSTTTITDTVSYTFLSATNSCSGGGHYVPCFGAGGPYVFNCAMDAATPQGCNQNVTNSLVPSESYLINIRFPFINATSPQWSNCAYSVTAASYGQYAYCRFTNSTAFILGEPALPHM